MNITVERVDGLRAADYNPRVSLSEGMKEYQKLKKSIETFGLVEPLILNDRTGVLVGGHQRLTVLKDLGIENVEVVHVDLDEAHEKALNVALNKISGKWDADKLEDLLRDLDLNFDIDVELTGFDTDELNTMFTGAMNELSSDDDTSEEDETVDGKKKHRPSEYLTPGYEYKSLKDIYGVPPFTVLNLSILNTRDTDWKNNNKFWKDKMINLGASRQGSEKMTYMDVSILDPTLCEIINRWFTPNIRGNKIFDTFAGGECMSFVSCGLGNKYTGIDIRQEQVDLNKSRATQYGLNECTYICDDGRNVDKYIQDKSMDLYFSCPPYYNLEVYSDLENDASNQDTYEDFYKILDEAFIKSIRCLKDNRFAVIVAGDIRDSKGCYYDFITDIKNTFKKNGCALYNEMILVNPIGQKAYTTGQAMINRKVHKVHQNVLVFYKGDTSKIKDEFYNLKDIDEDVYKKYNIEEEASYNED